MQRPSRRVAAPIEWPTNGSTTGLATRVNACVVLRALSMDACLRRKRYLYWCLRSTSSQGPKYLLGNLWNVAVFAIRAAAGTPCFATGPRRTMSDLISNAFRGLSNNLTY